MPTDGTQDTHRVCRGGLSRDGIYADDRDRKLWLETLGQACEKTGWRIHAWVMMNNHYHLLLVRLKRRLEQVYENHNREAEA
jgi:REP element-mobilizing transposase RayT